MNNKQILAGLALGAGLLGASVAPQIASAHGGEDHTKTHKDQKAPYIGVTYGRTFGGTSSLLRRAGELTNNTSLVAGVHLWF